MVLLSVVGALSLSPTAVALPPPTGAPSVDHWQQELLRVDDLRHNRRPLAASAVAADLLDAHPPREVARQARYAMGMALSDLDLNWSARRLWLEVVADDATDPVGRAATRALLAPHTDDLSAQLIVLSALLPEGVTAEALPPGPSDAARYTRALGRLDAGELAEARRQLGMVTGVLEGRARALEAGIAVQQGDLGGAARALGQAHRLAGERGDQALQDHTALTAGRLQYGLEFYEAAADSYGRVEPGRPLWPDAREEQAWAYFQNGQSDLALGNAVSLASPWGRMVPTPEVDLIKGIARLETCRFDEARQTAEDLRDELATTVAAMDGWLSIATPETAWDDSFGALDGGVGSRRAGAVPAGVWRVALRDRTLAARAAEVASLEAELDRIAQQKPVWVDAVGTALMNDLHRDLARAREAAGARVVASLQRQRAHLVDVQAQADVLAFEAVDGQRRMLQELARSPEPAVTGAGAPIDFAVDTQLVYWPFNGEFWADELDSYRVVMPSVCHELAAGSQETRVVRRL